MVKIDQKKSKSIKKVNLFCCFDLLGSNLIYFQSLSKFLIKSRADLIDFVATISLDSKNSDKNLIQLRFKFD